MFCTIFALFNYFLFLLTISFMYLKKALEQAGWNSNFENSTEYQDSKQAGLAYHSNMQQGWKLLENKQEENKKQG